MLCPRVYPRQKTGLPTYGAVPFWFGEYLLVLFRRRIGLYFARRNGNLARCLRCFRLHLRQGHGQDAVLALRGNVIFAHAFQREAALHMTRAAFGVQVAFAVILLFAVDVGGLRGVAQLG